MRSPRPRPARPQLQPGALAATLALALVAAACLPGSIRPTPPPTPTAPPAPTAPPTPTPTPGPPTPTPAPTPVAYRVERGDTLISIARKFKTDGRSIAYWNRATYPSLDPEGSHYNPNNLQLGWVLQVLPGQKYVPPEDDGESGEQVTPRPVEQATDDGVDYATPAP